MRIELDILGEPMGKQRPRLSTINGIARAFTPKETINYESKVVNAYKQVVPTGNQIFEKGETIFATIIAEFSLSKGDYGKKGLNKSGREKLENGYCIKHLDCDNIAKICLDALNGIAYYDDSQIACLVVLKKWVETTPKVRIILERKQP